MEYFRKIKYDITKPWLILGKGPSFKKYFELKDDFNIFGLNHVGNLVKCDICHFIDIDVLNGTMINNSKNLLCPWHMHENSKVMWKTLPHAIKYDPIFSIAESHKNNIYWYNCSTWKKGHYFPPITWNEVIQVRFFSAEAAFQILGMLGVKRVYSLGIDGGYAYAKPFLDLGITPFSNTRKTFDDQFKMIEATLQQFDMVWEQL